MDLGSCLRLLSLSAIWGGSFLFMRIGAPVLGPAWLMEGRVGSAALFLAVVAVLCGQGLQARRHWRPCLFMGLVNSALPFLLFGYAAQTLSASLLSVLNAFSPIWGALIAAAWTRTPLTARTMAGLALGLVGVAVLVGFDGVTGEPGAFGAILAALGATLLYGIATNYAKSVRGVTPLALAHGSMWAATLMLAPALPFFPPASAPGPGVLAAVLALGVVCSGLAYLLYFRLIADIGAAPALTVTYLIPVFGILWGWLFLGEPLGWRTLAGTGVVILGAALVTGFSPRMFFRPKEAANA